MAATSLSKHVLFYSKFCQYSTQVLATMTRKNMRARFVMVCVDDNRYQIPTFVDRVPLILTIDRKLLSDDDVFSFFESAESPSEDPMAADDGDFTFVDESTPSMSPHATGFMLLNDCVNDEFPRINTPDGDPMPTSSSVGHGAQHPQHQHQHQHQHDDVAGIRGGGYKPSNKTQYQHDHTFGVGGAPPMGNNSYMERLPSTATGNSSSGGGGRDPSSIRESRESELSMWRTNVSPPPI